MAEGTKRNQEEAQEEPSFSFTRLETSVVVGLDMINLYVTHPRTVEPDDWTDPAIWGGDWIEWCAKRYLDYPGDGIALYAICPEPESGRMSLAIGMEISDFLNKNPDMSYTQYKRRVARKLSQFLTVEIPSDAIGAWNIQHAKEVNA